MPELPPWLTPRGNTQAESYARGFALGEQRRQANQRAALERDQMVMQSAAQANAQAQRTAQAQAELAAEIERQKESAAVAQEELSIKKQAQAQKDAFAAKKTAGILAIGQKVGAGRPLIEAMMEHPEAWMGESGDLSGLASVKRAFEPAPATQPRIMTVPGAGTTPDIDVMQVGPNQWKLIPPSKSAPMSRQESAELDILKRNIMSKQSSLDKDKESLSFMPPESKSYKDTKASVDRQQAEIDKLMEQLRGTGKSPAKAAAGESKATQRLKAARQLMQDHPDWTKEQVIAEAKKQVP